MHFIFLFGGNQKSESKYPNHLVGSVFFFLMCRHRLPSKHTSNYRNEQVDIYIVYLSVVPFWFVRCASAITIIVIMLIDGMIRLKCKL